MSQKLLFVFNPHSGKGLIKNNLLEIVDTMVKAGFEVTIYTTQAQGDATRKIAEDAKNFDRVVCSGGDGTLDEVVTGMVQSGVNVPIGYIPAGSTNDFANSLEIPKNMVKAAQIAVNGKPFPCDMGYFNGDTFVYVAAFGLFTEVKGMTGPDVKLDDGVFEVTLIRVPRNPLELNEIIRCLTNRIDDTDMIYSFKTEELRITSREEVSWTLDGEYGGTAKEWEIRNRHKEVTILVDENSSVIDKSKLS